MGIGIELYCKNCHFKKELLLGKGLMYSKLENVISTLPIEQKEEVINILNQDGSDNKIYEKRIYYCPKCNHLSSNLFVELFNKGNSIFETNYACSECGTTMNDLKDVKDLINLNCPKCHQKQLDYKKTILWD